MQVLCLNSIGNYRTATSYLDFMAGFAQHSRHDFLFHDFIYQFDPDMDLDRFDAIVVLHNFWPMALSPDRKDALRRAKALKVLFLQDEYQYVRQINKGMADMGFHLMFTCVAEQDFDFFYPRDLIPSLEAVYPSLTGFVPDDLKSIKPLDFHRREIDIGYRSRVSPYYLGRIGDEKRVVAERFSAIARQARLKSNISINENDRIYGDAWIEFLRQCRFQLGTPSGASIADLNGEVIEGELAYRRAHPHAAFEDVWRSVLHSYEGNRVIDTISPRYFEYAAAGSVMILHEGAYGGILEADRHYLPVRKDYSNVQEVLEKMRDRSYCKTLQSAAHEDLILSGNYSFGKFVGRFDDILDRHRRQGLLATHVNPGEFYLEQGEKFNQARKVCRDGVHYTPTEAGRNLAAIEERIGRLLRVPILGPILKRVGGDPIVKHARGRAALMAALCAPELLLFGLGWLLWRALGVTCQPIDVIAKEILLLAYAKRMTVPLANLPRIWFRLEVVEDEQRLVLRTHPSAPDSAPKEVSRLITGESALARAALDFTFTHPLQTFSNCTFVWLPIFGELNLMRSGADEYYELPFLGETLVRWRALARFALRATLRRPEGLQLLLLNRIFYIK